jgi:hypothetical protein
MATYNVTVKATVTAMNFEKVQKKCDDLKDRILKLGDISEVEVKPKENPTDS